MNTQALRPNGRSRLAAVELMIERLRSTSRDVRDGLPHWADPQTGRWTTTPEGDWTGGAWLGMLWCAARLTGDAALLSRAKADLVRLQGRLPVRSAFRGFPFYYGAALAAILHKDDDGLRAALACALSLREMFSPALGLIPLGSGAEEGSDIGETISSIDSLQASPLLYWVFAQTGDRRYLEVARAHTERVLSIHQHEDGSIIQSSELDPSGKLVRHFTHKGYSDSSIWGRAQAWGMLYAAMAAEADHEPERWLPWAERSARWWIDHLPAAAIAPWDFSAPGAIRAIPDTAATAIACVALLKLAATTTDETLAREALATATRSVEAMLNHHLTPQTADDTRPAGMLLDACFNYRADSRPQDAVRSCEFIVGSYFLLQALLVLEDRIAPSDF